MKSAPASSRTIAQRSDATERQREDEVDVVGRARFTLQRARDAATDEVLAPDRFDGGRDENSDLERVEPGSSSHGLARGKSRSAMLCP